MRLGIIGTCLLPFSLLAQDSVTTLTGQPLVSGASNGPVAIALFNDPAALVADAAGNLFIADSRNHVIRRISTNGIVSTFAGQAGTSGSSDGTGAARFDTPTGIALAPNGDLYISDTGNHTIRRVTPAGAVTTFAGMAGQSGSTDASGTSARFNSPLGLALAADRTIFVADSGNHLVRAIAPDRTVRTLAGRAETWGTEDGAGGNARFNGPVGVAINPDGDIFVSDSNNHTIRRITRAGMVITSAGVPGTDGSADGHRFAATFSKPAELAFDKHGNLFVADSFNHLIRKISPAGEVSTVTGVAGADGSVDGSNGQARLFNPYGLAIGPDGSLVVSDTYNELIRIVLAPFAIAVQMSDDGAAISWQSLIGKTYQPQYQNELSPGPWVNLGPPVTATNLNTSVADNSAGPAAARIYRAIVLP
jgi:streptogramin lyase